MTAKNLVIVESPAKAKTIHKYLGKDYMVEASMGHVRDLPKSEMGIDVDNGFTPRYIVMSKSRKVVSKLKKAAKGKEIVFLAADPDREGEAICWHLASILEGSSRLKRVTFNEITLEAIHEAFRHPRDIDMKLVDAQQARRILDRIVGYNLSPLLWKKVRRGLSAGRVQSVALRLIAEREKEVKAFKPAEYWTIDAKLESGRHEEKGRSFLAALEKIKHKKAEIGHKKQAEDLKKILEKLPFHVKDIEFKKRTRRPQPPYTTSKMQQEAYNRLRFPAAKTMSVAQKLYEGVELGEEGSVGLISYMRTDAVHVARSAQAQALRFIREKYGAKYAPRSAHQYRSKKGAQAAHEAIRPTSVYREPDAIKSFLTEDEFKLYDLIWRKFVASQMTAAVEEMIAITILAGEDYLFKTTGKKTVFPGFLAVVGNHEDEKELPRLIKGEKLILHEIIPAQHFTKPPARYNDASLVKTLEEMGIGRPSTYAPTINTLLARDYVERHSGALIPTELAQIVVDLLMEHFPNIMDYKFTADMEEELDEIEEGKLGWLEVVRDFFGPFSKKLSHAKDKMKDMKKELIETEYRCDVCGKPLVIRWGRFGKFLACSGFPECKYTRSIPTGFRCPEEGCGGELVRRQSGRRRIFYGCSRYPDCKYTTNRLPKPEEHQPESPAKPSGEAEPAEASDEETSE